MELSKHQTNVAKGIAICLMFIHHLYGVSDRLLDGNDYSQVISALPIEFYVARFGNICVSVFLFLSGYGLFLGYSRSSKRAFHYAWTKLVGFYKTYWLYFLIFVPIGLVFFRDVTLWDSPQIRYAADPATFLMNFLGWQSTYNQEWWFVRLFAITLIVLFPLYGALAKKGHAAALAVLSAVLLCIGYRVNPYGPLGFAFWQSAFALGIIYARFNLFSTPSLRRVWKTWGGALCCIALMFAVRTFALDSSPRLDFLMAAFFIPCSIKVMTSLRLAQAMAYLGRYSFPLWLIHSFFCYYYFQSIIYFPRWSPFVFLWLLALSLLTVLGIAFLWELGAGVRSKLSVQSISNLRRLPRSGEFLKPPL